MNGGERVFYIFALGINVHEGKKQENKIETRVREFFF